MNKKLLRYLDPISAMGFGWILASIFLFLSSANSALFLLIVCLVMVGGSFAYHYFSGS
ncbi:MAG: hypothetical protein UX47_C0001G0230 [Candidatus Collierbacteria bacterium GW2011_GWA2_46_26]|uniref:Uncharacterized protein n=1 Tax=Candidatus Collierbacteria bacterium GW2011_GWA2_46_26 TaxID=1618381 RepID=A0A0G1PMM6_9BACT|nr:MAG: hypothetical protein UX47_C0001G0230 [Candidatus Collierbacteria bacterium GW2011_GWA2_46_26]